jgi:hypothetical protein
LAANEIVDDERKKHHAVVANELQPFLSWERASRAGGGTRVRSARSFVKEGLLGAHDVA